MHGPLLIRADASTRIGTGHVMRCLAIAQHWRRAGGRVVVAQAQTTPALVRRLADAGVETAEISGVAGSLEDAAATAALARDCRAAWVIADGYAFGSPWQQRVREAGLRLLVIDDYGHAGQYHADVILNQNASARPGLYAGRHAGARLLLGTRFALLRDEFLPWREWRRTVPDQAKKVLLTFGGGDTDNVTGKILAELAPIGGLEIIAVVGGSNPHLSAIRQSIDRQESAVRLVVDSTRMPDLMAEADVAVSAAGSTSWELAFMGLPSILVVTADNQAASAAELDREGVCVNLGDHRALPSGHLLASLQGLLRDGPGRRTMSERARTRVDGHGVARVAAALNPGLRLSIVSDADSWLNPSIAELKADWEAAGHLVRWVHDPGAVEAGDISLLLSLSRIVAPKVLGLNAHNLVVHASALPAGRGWSPLTWQILEGRNEIPITLFEAGETVDSGPVYAQEMIRFTGGELVDELRRGLAEATVRLCRGFVARYPFSCSEGRAQAGEPSHYPRRRAADSRLDIDKTVREQFNLLRVADPVRYPAFFEIAGRRYEVTLRAADHPAP